LDFEKIVGEIFFVYNFLLFMYFDCMKLMNWEM
jgi:hypothetical protein